MKLLERHFEMALAAPDGIKKLRELILTLAMQGKLVPQDPADPPASELLKEIEAEKRRLVKEGKLKKQEPLPPIKPEEVPYEVPAGWAWVRFGTVTINRDSERVPVAKDNRINIKGIYDYYGASGIIDQVNDYIFDKALLLIGEDGANLINRSTPIAFIAQGKYWVNNHAHVIDGISYDFLKYIENYINSIDLKPYVTGTAQPKMNQAKMNSILVPLPSLAEQKRIVAKIDQLMVVCDRLEAERNERNRKRLILHRTAMDQLLSAADAPSFDVAWSFIVRNFSVLYSVPENVVELKKAILQLAVMGKLVSQNPADQPASELLKQIEAEKRRLVKEGKIKKQEPLPAIKPEELPCQLPFGWVSASMLELGYFLGGKTPSTNKNSFWNGTIPWVSAKDMKTHYIKDSEDHITEDGVASGLAMIPAESILMVVRSGILRRTFPVAINSVNCTINQDLKALVLFSNVYSEYVLLMLRGFEKLILNRLTKRGMTVESVMFSEFAAYKFPLPPLAEQQRIVAKVDSLLALCDTLAQQLQESADKQTAILNAVVAGM
jgi:type I restriction enzyme, S subunit